ARRNDTMLTGITGQSSTRGTWWMPKTYQSTTSVSSIGRCARVQTASPSSEADWFTNSPHGHRSSAWNGVTHSVWPITWARSNTGDDGSIIAGNAPDGTSLYAVGVPCALRRVLLWTFQAR